MASIKVSPADAITDAAVVVPTITKGSLSITAPCAIVVTEVQGPATLYPPYAVAEAALGPIAAEVAWPPTDASAAEVVAVAPSINLGNVLVNRPIAIAEAGFSPPIVTWAWLEPVPVPAEVAAVAPTILFGATEATPNAAISESAAVAPGVAYGSVTVTPSDAAAAEVDIRSHELWPPWIAEGRGDAFSLATGAA